MAWSEETWSVGEATIQGKPIVYKFMNEFPDNSTRSKMEWLTVVSWRYDGSSNNGVVFQILLLVVFLLKMARWWPKGIHNQ
ncbi:hypothetical protein OPW36_21315 [Vibrio europaeus]|uniref:hypothetical protein n=1 Tax=Vibrio europaeus TaxID=300876 RepID=UPI001E2B0A62|nr:hypothetical protein [Vibrio europaeus]MDC5806743.1 hypothetical protein [Vibrio europaeus]MDC5810145.1 hypothetical protein [Vibrio europaeus]MDC5827268.1 hypothetical protein [Vibrio europaeus]MDC5830112.1 hypothetical protein [Vibrio europaeus]MDC5836968.1 hypothetical protein [Vibrio europaeus]